MISKLTHQQNVVSQQPQKKQPSSSDGSTERTKEFIMDSTIISDEAKAKAAKVRARWNAGEMSWAEKQEFVYSKSGIFIQDADGTFPGVSDEQLAIWQARKADRQREILSQTTHGLLGAFNFVAGNGQPFTARIGFDGIWILREHYTHHNQRPYFEQIDSSTGVSGIDQPTVRKLDFMFRIVQNLR